MPDTSCHWIGLLKGIFVSAIRLSPAVPTLPMLGWAWVKTAQSSFWTESKHPPMQLSKKIIKEAFELSLSRTWCHNNKTTSGNNKNIMYLFHCKSFLSASQMVWICVALGNQWNHSALCHWRSQPIKLRPEHFQSLHGWKEERVDAQEQQRWYLTACPWSWGLTLWRPI